MFIVSLILCCPAGYVESQDHADAVYQLEIPLMNIAGALNSLAEQTGVTLLFPYDTARFVQANSVVGQYTIQEALSLVLQDTGFSGGYNDNGVLMISPKESTAPNKRGNTVKNTGQKIRRGSLIATLVTAFSSSIISVNSTAQGLEEIVVTAQKRDQRLQDVPISIQVLTGDVMKEQNLGDLQAAAALLPNVIIAETSNSVSANMRGIFTDTSNPGFEQSVAIFNDGMYYGRPLIAVASLFDQGQLEALMGPQPVYFGQSAIAGLISYRSVRPELEEGTNGYGIIELGEDGNSRYEGAIGGSFSDDWAARISGRFNEHDGWTTTFPDGRDANATENWGLRASLSGKIGDSISLWAKTEKWNRESDGAARVTVHCEPLPLATCDDALAGGIAANMSPGSYTVNTGSTSIPPGFGPISAGQIDFSQLPEMQNDAFGIDADGTTHVLELKWQINDGLLLTSLTGSAEYDQTSTNDIDRVPYADISIETDEFYDQWSQEFRIQSTTDAAVQWMAGAYWQEQEVAQNFLIYSARTLRGAPGVSGTQYNEEADYANVFGSVTWAVTDTVTLDIGARYTDVSKERSNQDNLSADLFDVNGDLLVPNLATPPVAMSVGELYPGANYRCLGISLVEGVECTDPLDYNDNELTYSFSLNWDITDNHTLWARHAKGWKAGGFSSGSGAHAVPSFGNYEGETAKSYEVGGHFSFAEGSARLSASYYFTEYNDQQVAQQIVVGGRPNQFFSNSGASTVQGIELNGNWVAGGFSLNGSFATMDSEWDDFTAVCTTLELADVTSAGAANGITGAALIGYTGPAGCTVTALRGPGAGAGDVSMDGMEFDGAPDWSASLSAGYRFPIGDTVEAKINVSASMYDEWNDTRGVLTPYRSQSSFAVMNINASLSDLDGAWAVSLFGRNITDEWYWLQQPGNIGGLGTTDAVIGQSEVWGLQLRYNYGQ